MSQPPGNPAPTTSRRGATALTRGSRTPFPQPRHTTSLMKRAETSPSPEEAALKQETYPIYELDWEKLRVFLEERFYPLEFECRIVHNDRYLFHIPKTDSLSEDDLLAIARLRKKKPEENEQRRSQSPPEW